MENQKDQALQPYGYAGDAEKMHTLIISIVHSAQMKSQIGSMTANSS